MCVCVCVCVCAETGDGGTNVCYILMQAVLADITAVSVIPLLKLALAADRGRERES